MTWMKRLCLEVAHKPTFRIPQRWNESQGKSCMIAKDLYNSHFWLHSILTHMCNTFSPCSSHPYCNKITPKFLYTTSTEIFFFSPGETVYRSSAQVRIPLPRFCGSRFTYPWQIRNLTGRTGDYLGHTKRLANPAYCWMEKVHTPKTTRTIKKGQKLHLCVALRW